MTKYEREKGKIIRLIAQKDKIAIINDEVISCIEADCSICGMCYVGSDYASTITEWLNSDDGEVSLERKAGQEEAWELARKIVACAFDGEIGASKLRDIFNTDLQFEIFRYYTYAEAAAKVKAWTKAELKPGDIVRTQYNPDDCGDMVVLENYNACEKNIRVMYGNFCTRLFAESDLVKTGRTVPVQDWKKQWCGTTLKSKEV